MRCQQSLVRFVLLPVAFGFIARPYAAADKLFSERNDAISHFYGTIGRTLEIEMTLTKHGPQIEGTYEYATHRQAISLKGKLLKPYEYELEEVGPNNTPTARFKINEAGSPSTWESADGKRKLSVVLSEITPDQHQLLQRIWGAKPQVLTLVAGFDHACVMRSLGGACWGTVPAMPGLASGGPEMTAYRALPHLFLSDNVTAYSTSSHPGIRSVWVCPPATLNAGPWSTTDRDKIQNSRCKRSPA